MVDFSHYSDEALICACRERNEGAWQVLVSRYERLVYTIPLRSGLTRAEADDVFQMVWVTLLQNLDTLREPGRVSAWLVTTAKRASWERQRKLRRELAQPAGYDDWCPPAELLETPPEAIVEQYQQQQRVRSAMTNLKEPCHSLLPALYYDRSEPSYKEISANLDIAIGSIGPTRARCLDKLRRIMDEN